MKTIPFQIPQEYLSLPMFQGGRAIVRLLRDAGYIAYWAGGCVRDMAMQRMPEDIDIATNATPDEIIHLFRKTIPVGKQFGVIIVLWGGFEYEVATFRKDLEYTDGRRPLGVIFSDAHEDASRRDFTINGLFFCPQECKMIDYVNGLADIKRKIIQTIGDPRARFFEDKLRMLRAIRFAVRFNYHIEKNTYNEICQRVKEINKVSYERIRDELIKTVKQIDPPFLGLHNALILWFDTGLLFEIIPEARKQQTMIAETYPNEFRNTKWQNSFSKNGELFQILYRVMDVYIAFYHKKEENMLNVDLFFALMLHFLGEKKITRETSFFDWFWSCPDTKIIHGILSRLKFKNTQRVRIVDLLRSLSLFNDFFQLSLARKVRTIRENDFDKKMDLLYILRETWDKDSGYSQKIVDFKIEYEAQNDLFPTPVITGYDLKQMGFPTGPVYKKIILAVEDQQLENKISTKEQAIQFIKQHGEFDAVSK